MNSTRREWLWGGLAAGALSGAPAYRPQLAVQVFVWTQYLQKEKRTLAEGVEDIISGCRAAGYEHAEFMSAFFAPVLRERTFALLEKHALKIPICYHGGPMHTAADAAKTSREILDLAGVLQPVGTRIINTNPSPKPDKAMKSAAELDIQAKALDELGAALAGKGMRLIVHHHDPEMRDGAREWRHILKNTRLDLCLDLMWVARGGQNPLALLKEAGRRVATLHVRNMQDGVCTEAAGPGEIDYPAAVKHLKSMGWSGWAIVELFHEPGTRVSRPLVENLRLSRDYVATVFEA